MEIITDIKEYKSFLLLRFIKGKNYSLVNLFKYVYDEYYFRDFLINYTEFDWIDIIDNENNYKDFFIGI